MTPIEFILTATGGLGLGFGLGMYVYHKLVDRNPAYHVHHLPDVQDNIVVKD